ncbi:hypothetical protein M9H77_28977 [Catharanthus roseus]|uniref:Uncharacterized protein n=1 Tax=Catharanthus roseus TaxID=4058 RepID=A0ACC0AHU2_CATRO|nr:hypothetical protein M9H77_28977 [Catharanthus roseus]
MGDCTVETSNNKKRTRDCSSELETDSPELKRVNSYTYLDPTPSESPESNHDERESESTRMIREDILDILDDSETVPATQDLDSFIRSFEEEILQASPSAAQPVVVELTSDSGESQPDLGYLLEASDDELGLPPTVNSLEIEANNESNADVLVELRNMTGFGDDLQLQEYDDAFGLGLVEKPIEGGNYAGGGDYVTVDGLFDYTEPSDFSDLSWRPESLPAL